MNFPVSAWAIRNPIIPLVIFLLLAVLGMLSWHKLPIQGMPSIVIPIIQVTVAQAGAAPEDLERQVARRLETGLAAITGVKHVTTVCEPGSCTSTLEFSLDIPVDRAISDVRQAVSQVRPALPASVLEPVISRLEIEGQAMRTYVVGVMPGHQRNLEALSWFIDDVLARRLQGVAGVAQVSRQGGVAREVQVRLDPAKLVARGITAVQVDDHVRATWADVPGGRFDGGGERAIRVMGAAGGLEALRASRLSVEPGHSVALSELGEISDTAAEPTSLARLDGQPAVAFGVFRAKGASEVDVAERIDAELERIRAEQPWARIDLIIDQVEYTKISFESAITALVEGALLAVVVVWIFLRDRRATIIAAVAIPLSVIPTFAAMEVAGFSLNGISLLALSLVSGILVDDAIVEIENIVRHQHLGMKPYRAAIFAADRIGLAVVATTMTIVAVFLPVSFMGGIPGKYFIEFGLTVAFAVVASLLVARLLTPMMAAYLLSPVVTAEEPAPGRIATAYQRFLAATIDHPGRTLAVGAMVLVGSFSLVPLLPSGFIAASDRGIALLQVELPPGLPLSQADRTISDMAEKIQARPEVSAVFANIAVPRSMIIIKLKPRGERKLNQQEFQEAIRPLLVGVPDQRFGFLAENGQKEVQILVTGDDPIALTETARTLAAEMRGVRQIANVTTAADLPRPEIRLLPKTEQLAHVGVSAGQLAQLARIATLGNDETTLAKIELDSRQVPIRVLIDPQYRADVSVLRGLRVPTATGSSVPLAAVVDVVQGASAGRIERFDRARRIAIEADLANATLGEALAAVHALPSLQHLPANVRLVNSGDAEVMGELFMGFAIAMVLGVLLVYLVLVLLYGDFLHPLTILVALPLSAGGAIGALLLADLALDLSSLIGLLMLMGIVCKNTILLVDAAIISMHEGLTRRAALLHAGAVRARPIIMTTLAMVAGMLPIAFGLGGDAAFRRPMALAVIGGLIASTVLSLVLVPAVFVAVDGLRQRLARLGGRFVTPADSDT